MDWLKEFEEKAPLKEVKPFELNRMNQIQNSQTIQPQNSQNVPKKKVTKPKAKKNVAPPAKKENPTEETDENESQQTKGIINDDKAEDQMAVIETYADYKPAKLTIGMPHPDAVVETSSLSSVAPTDITYKLKIPKKTIKSGALSALQLESIIYASQAHQHFLQDDSRAGFLIGIYFYFNISTLYTHFTFCSQHTTKELILFSNICFLCI